MKDSLLSLGSLSRGTSRRELHPSPRAYGAPVIENHESWESQSPLPSPNKLSILSAYQRRRCQSAVDRNAGHVTAVHPPSCRHTPVSCVGTPVRQSCWLRSCGTKKSINTDQPAHSVHETSVGLQYSQDGSQHFGQLSRHYSLSHAQRSCHHRWGRIATSHGLSTCTCPLPSRAIVAGDMRAQHGFNGHNVLG